MNYKERSDRQNAIIEQNHVSAQEIDEALDFHLQQLSRMGLHLEDEVCRILRKFKAQVEAREELERIILEQDKEGIADR
jgi:hypothetical protein